MYIPSVHIRKYIFACKSKNIFRCTVFRLLESAFVKLPYPWHDLIINPPCRTAAPPISFPKKVCSLIFHEKLFLEKGLPIL